MNINAKIYVAGHKGLVGSSITKRLEANGYTNIITRSHAELDLTRQAETEEFFRKVKPEYVFLCAAKVGGILANNTYKGEFIYQNMMIAANIINAAYLTGVKKLLNLGSSCIYPKFARQPMNENELLTGPLEPTNEPYAIAKISAIKLCRYYNEQYGTNYISAMPTNLYGPGDNFDLMNSHVLPALIRKFHLAKLLAEGNHDAIRKDIARWDCNSTLPDKGKVEIASFLERHLVTAKTVGIWGTGSPCREFLYVDDLADACAFLMTNYDFNRTEEFINIGFGEDVTIEQLAQIIRETVGFQGNIVFDRSKPDGTPKKLLDISKIRSFGWAPKTGLREGIQKTYDWYRATA